MVLKSLLNPLKGATPNHERLLSYLLHLQSFAKEQADGTHKLLALSQEDKQARDKLLALAKSLSLQASTDAVGNMTLLHRGAKDLPPVVIGGHLDATAYEQVHGGALSLALGFEVLEMLRDAHIVTKRPIALLNFTNTEGERFAPSLLGSSVLTQALPFEEMLCVPSRDLPKQTLGRNLKTHKYAGQVRYHMRPVHAYLEIQTEQYLNEAKPAPLGLIKSTYGVYHTEYTFHKYSKTLTAALQRVLKEEISAGVLASLTPTSEANTLLLDIRHENARALNQLQQQLDLAFAAHAHSTGTELHRRELVRLAPALFDDALLPTLEQAARAASASLSYSESQQPLDAQMMMSKCPSAVIFVNCSKHNKKNSFLNMQAASQLLFESVVALAMQ